MDALLLKIAAVVLIVNAVLAGAKVVLDKLVVQFPQLQAADSVVGKIADVVGKILDFVSANVQHKDQAPKA